MSTASITPQKKRKEAKFPPRRGQIKAQIFESMAKTVVSVVSKAKQALEKNKGEGSDDGKSSSSQPQSGYNSERNSDIS